MAIEQIGRAKSVAITSPALTFNDVFDVELDPDIGEVHKSYGGPSRFASRTVGNDNATISFKTRNPQAFTELVKNLELETVVITFQAPHVTPTPGSIVVGLQHEKELTCTISHAFVEDSIKLNTGSDGKPAEFQVKLGLGLANADGAEPTVEWDLAASGA